MLGARPKYALNMRKPKIMAGPGTHISPPIQFCHKLNYDDILDQKEVLIILNTPKICFFFKKKQIEKCWSFEG